MKTDGSSADLGNGYCKSKRTYDECGNLVSIKCYDNKDDLCIGDTGYAQLQRDYSGKRLIQEQYLDEDGKLMNVGGYAEVRYDYTPKGQLSLVNYYDANGTELEQGSAYMHEYLQSLKDRDISIIISIKDEGTKELTETLLNDLSSLGLKESLKGKSRYSYYAVIDGDMVTEELGQKCLTHVGKLGDEDYTVISAGYSYGNQSSIVIEGVEYSQNVRGINIVVYDNRIGKVVDTVAFDTHTKEMWVTR